MFAKHARHQQRHFDLRRVLHKRRLSTEHTSDDHFRYGRISFNRHGDGDGDCEGLICPKTVHLTAGGLGCTPRTLSHNRAGLIRVRSKQILPPHYPHCLHRLRLASSLNRHCIHLRLRRRNLLIRKKILVLQPIPAKLRLPPTPHPVVVIVAGAATHLVRARSLA